MFFRLFSIAVLLVLLGAPGTVRAEDTAETPRETINDGYSLLYKLCKDESQLHLIVLIKTTPPEIADFARRISQEGDDDAALLEKIQAADHHIRLDKQPLPQFEVDVRQSIRDEKQHLLLFGSKSGNFVRALLVSQIEAATYGANIAKVLIRDDPRHAETLGRIADHWARIRHDAYRLLDAQ